MRQGSHPTGGTEGALFSSLETPGREVAVCAVSCDRSLHPGRPESEGSHASTGLASSRHARGGGGCGAACSLWPLETCRQWKGWHERPQARAAGRQVVPPCCARSLRSLRDTAGRIMAQKREQWNTASEDGRLLQSLVGRLFSWLRDAPYLGLRSAEFSSIKN